MMENKRSVGILVILLLALPLVCFGKDEITMTGQHSKERHLLSTLRKGYNEKAHIQSSAPFECLLHELTSYIVSQGVTVLPILKQEYLSSKDIKYRRYLLYVMRAVDKTKSESIFLTFLKDAGEKEQPHILQMMNDAELPESVETFFSMIDSGSLDIRRAAADSIERAKALYSKEKYIKKFRELLEDKNEDVYIRSAAIVFLHRQHVLGDAEVLQLLEDFEKMYFNLEYDKRLDFRSFPQTCLVLLGSKGSREKFKAVFLKYLEDSFLRRTAYEYLEAIGGEPRSKERVFTVLDTLPRHDVMKVISKLIDDEDDSWFSEFGKEYLKHLEKK